MVTQVIFLTYIHLLEHDVVKITGISQSCFIVDIMNSKMKEDGVAQMRIKKVEKETGQIRDKKNRTVDGRRTH